MESKVENGFFGKSVLVTGAGRGFGRAIVSELHRQGAKIYALSKTKENLDSLIDELPTNIVPICVDLSKWKETETALENVERVDCLINNAAFMDIQDFLEITEEQFDLQMNVNTKALLHVSQIVARKMIAEGKPGTIVNISSVKASLANVPPKVIEEGVEAFMTTKSVTNEAYVKMEEIVRTVLFLGSGANVHLTGTDVKVDGGFLMM